MKSRNYSACRQQPSLCPCQSELKYLPVPSQHDKWLRSRTFGNSLGMTRVGGFILCPTVCGKSFSDAARSVISCYLTHLPQNNVDCSQTHWVCEWVTFSTWLWALFFLPQAFKLVCVSHCVRDVQRKIKEVFLIVSHTHTNHCLFWFKTVFAQLLDLPPSFSPPWWLSLFPVTAFSLRLSLENFPPFQTDTYSADCWSTCFSLSQTKYLTFFSSALLLCPLGCVLRNNRLCNVFALTMQLYENALTVRKCVWVWKGERNPSLCPVFWATFRFVYLGLAFYPHFSVSFLLCFSFFFLNVTSLLTAFAGMCFNSALPLSSPPLLLIVWLGLQKKVDLSTPGSFSHL